MIKALIVDDSPTIRQLIRAIFSTDPELHVVGEAQNGEEAIDMVARLHPDVVTMDIHMPEMDGYEAIRRIMAESPVPIVILTSTESDIRLGVTYKGVDSGALMVFGKPHGLPEDDPGAHELIKVVKAMSDVKVVRRRWPAKNSKPVAKKAPSPSIRPSHSYRIVAVGASTGGPPALQTILGDFPTTFPAPVVLVQHISKGFTAGLARWLNETVPIRVVLAKNGELLLPGTVYVAPDDVHLQVTRERRAALLKQNPLDGHRPSVTALFNSVAKHYGAGALGVLLTGMGRDGADGLYAIKQEGGYTIAQDEASSIVFGMPKEAIAMDAALKVLALDAIGRNIRELILL